MDPDAALAEIRDLTAGYDRFGSLNDHDTARLIELVQAMDTWMSNEGFLPTDWNALRSPLRSTSTENVTRVQRGGVGTRAGN